MRVIHLLRKYDPADGCRTVTCPGYWGHVYTRTGRQRLSAAVAWTGRYRVDGQAWQDIVGTFASQKRRVVYICCWVKARAGVVWFDDVDMVREK